MTSSRLQEKIARLRAVFVDELPQRMEEIQTLYQRLLNQGEDAAAMRELHRLLHSIKGTSASFGMTELSRVAASAEGEAQQILDKGWPGPALLQRELGRFLAALHHVVHGTVEQPRSGRGGGPGFELPADAATPTRQQPLLYLCDDDALQAEQLATQVTCFGYRVERFTDPAALAEAVAARRPDAVIMDIVFPDSPDAGVERLGALQARRETPLPSVFISARTDFDARLRAAQAGGAAYFPKPVSVLDLVDTLDELTHRQEPEPYRVMVVDDEHAIAEYHSLILEDAGMQTLVVNRPEKVLDQICEFNPDLVLMDMYMPVCTGPELAQVIRQIPAFVSLPIVYLSSETDERKQFSALRVGADGFLTKPIEADRLIEDVAVRAERMRTLRGLMLRDSLTGLYNHTTIKQLLKNALLSGDRKEQTVSFVMIDVDNFKSVNDQYGHPVGDQVLLALARLLQQRLRQSDLIGRYGGEEFAVVMSDADAEQARRIIDALREDFAWIRFFADAGPFTCTFSAGVSAFPDYLDADSLCEASDRALYSAKDGGRNRVIAAQKKAGD